MKTLQYVREMCVAWTMMGYGGQNVLQGKRDVEVRISSMDVMLGEDGRVHRKCGDICCCMGKDRMRV